MQVFEIKILTEYSVPRSLSVPIAWVGDFAQFVSADSTKGAAK
jgi:hypothetical protein